MKPSILIILSVLCLQGKMFTQTINMDDPAQYLPSVLQQVHMGMPKAEYLAITDSTQWTRDTKRDYLFVGYTQEVNRNQVASVTYKFDTPEGTKNIESPLYEIIIVFTDSISAANFAAEKFKSFPRMTEFADKEWFLPTSKDYRLLVRLKGNTLRIAANMSGTEWGFD